MSSKKTKVFLKDFYLDRRSPGATFKIIPFKVGFIGSALACVGLGVRGVGEKHDLNKEHLGGIPQRALCFNHVLKLGIFSLQSSVDLGKCRVCCLLGQQVL